MQAVHFSRVLFIAHQNRSCWLIQEDSGSICIRITHIHFVYMLWKCFFTVWILIFIFERYLHWTARVRPDLTFPLLDWSSRTGCTTFHDILLRKNSGCPSFLLHILNGMQSVAQLLQYKHIPFAKRRLISLPITISISRPVLLERRWKGRRNMPSDWADRSSGRFRCYSPVHPKMP